jgi:hypothetical protein
MSAESDSQVLQLLIDAGYWDDAQVWRPVGDNENNKGIVGNQQEDPVSALVEKLTNSIDAVLIDKCLEAGIDPRSAEAPQSMRAAVGRFFEETDSSHKAGRTRHWGIDVLNKDELDSIAGNVWLSATGSKTAPSLTVADRGEGQTPDDFPKTFMALIGFKLADGTTESQKRDIPFVQGQFNMGSSGVYPYASKQNGFQFLLSRRNPALLASVTRDRDLQWGFTVVRRTRKLKGSVFEYLAPVKNANGPCDVLAFASETMPILPETPPRNTPNAIYATEVEYGTLVKLYEYQFRAAGVSYSHVLMKSGLMRQVELAMPECGLPIRMVEGRDYQGRPGSFQNNVLGIMHRMETLAAKGALEDEIDNPEDHAAASPLRLEGSPVSGEMMMQGVVIPWTAFVFRENAGDRTRNGKYALILHVNGQKHAHKGVEFFRTRAVGYPYLASNNTILVVVDCTNFDYLQREEIFKPSRDRLHTSELSTELIDLLSDSLKKNEQLEQLQNQQHQRKQAERLNNRAPIRSVLEQLLKASPMLARFFKLGPDIKIGKPYKDGDSGEGNGTGKFVGRKHPTFFHLRNGSDYKRQVAHIGGKSRIQFTTDVEDSYFYRASYPGLFSARYTNIEKLVSGNRANLHDGAFSFSVSLPDSAEVGDSLEMEFSLSDGVIEDALVCRVTLDIEAQTEPSGGGGGRRRTSTEKGGKTGGQTKLGDMDIVKCCKVFPARYGCDQSWPDDSWSDFTAVKLEPNPETGGITYLVNVDNLYLLDYQKQSVSKDPSLIEAKFMWSLVLMSLSIVEHYRKLEEEQSDEEEIQESVEDSQGLMSRRDEDVERMTTACAQLILPSLDAVATMTSDLIEEQTDFG